MKLRFFFSLLATFSVMVANADSPKYIFYFIGDGMGHGQVMATETYNRLALGNAQLLPMSSLPVNSFVTTYSYSSPVTDSAAAGTALSTGSKTRNGMLGMSADTIPVYSVAKHLHDDGYGVGIITTVAMDDATPGAFYAHVPNRAMFYEIGRQAAESGYEVIGGASLRGTKDKDGNPNDLLPYIKSHGVDIVEGIDAMRASDSRRVLLVPENPRWGWNGGYAIDNYEGAPSLAEMTSATIDHLMKHTPDRFFIMSEGGSIDHAGHGNDGGTMIKETIAFNDAIQIALDFYNQHPDETLIIITADHETGGVSVGNQYSGYNAYLQYFVPQTISKDLFSGYCDELKRRENPVTWDEMKQILTDKLGFYTSVPISDKQDQHLRHAFNKAFIEGSDERLETLYANIGSFPNEVFKILNTIAGIGWTTHHHSGNFVPLYAIGVGSELFVGNNDNTRVPQKILQAVNQ